MSHRTWFVHLVPCTDELGAGLFKGKEVNMKASHLDLMTTTQPLMELDEQDLFEVAGGQYTVARYHAIHIVNFGLALGTGGTVTATRNSVTATAGTNGVAAVAGFVGSLNAAYG
jgi:hypothetical protein